MTRRSFALFASVVAAPVLIALTAGAASAHFVLQAPAAYSEQNFAGSPQKSAPCGQDDPMDPVVPTNAVTTFQAGSTIDITIDEIITHPGHYRVSLAPSLEALPVDPPVTPGTNVDCGATTIDANPVLPVLADGELVHTSAFNGPQTMHVKLPDGMTCDHCVLQVAEFMSNHDFNNPGGCFYHHCATVSVTSGPVPDAGPNDPDASPGSGDGGVSNPANDGDGGCGCHIGGHSSSSSSAILFGSLFCLVVLAARRRRRD